LFDFAFLFFCLAADFVNKDEYIDEVVIVKLLCSGSAAKPCIFVRTVRATRIIYSS